uniref:ORF84a n=1 Tax=Pinus koraiensis TaxID=88728 RepID=Q85X77_PINKO|nr:ORF84a [Pinus koraiensis]
MSWCGNNSTGNLKTFTNMTFHLSTKYCRGFHASDNISYFSMIICDDHLITKIFNLLFEPFCIMFTISTCTTHTNSHLSSKYLSN